MYVIEIEDLYFSYDGKVNVLEGVNLKIGKGEFVGIVGPLQEAESGCLART